MNRLFICNHNRYLKCHFNSDYSIVEVVLGSFFIISREILDEIVFFDKDIFLYCEENIRANKLEQ